MQAGFAVLATLVICLWAFTVSCQTVTVQYHMGTSLTSGYAVKFTFSRLGSSTVVSWDQFGAAADGSGVISSNVSDTIPTGFEFGNLYRGYPPMAATRWSYVYYNDVGMLILNSTNPVVTVIPNNNVSAFTAGQIITVRSGALIYYNDAVNLTGQGGSIAALGTTLTASTSAASTSTAATTTTGTTNAASVTTLTQNGLSTTSEGCCVHTGIAIDIVMAMVVLVTALFV